jgi:hypothetical protein
MCLWRLIGRCDGGMGGGEAEAEAGNAPTGRARRADPGMAGEPAGLPRRAD